MPISRHFGVVADGTFLEYTWGSVNNSSYRRWLERIVFLLPVIMNVKKVDRIGVSFISLGLPAPDEERRKALNTTAK